jgi:hypothetical protein
MTQLRIKEIYKGLTITKKIFFIQASVTLDASKFLSQEELAAFYRFEEFKEFIESYNNEDDIFEKEVDEQLFDLQTNPTDIQPTIINYKNVTNEKPKQKRGRRPKAK